VPLLLTATACGTATPVANGTPVGGHASGVAVTKHLGSADNGRTISLRRGEAVLVSLPGPDWTFQVPSDTSVVAASRQKAVHVSPRQCQPEKICGSVNERVTAVSPGHSTVTAVGRVCGEAYACDNNKFRVTLVVPEN
jgi:predicted secreted protein